MEMEAAAAVVNQMEMEAAAAVVVVMDALLVFNLGRGGGV